jgi:hypothetical protein
MKKVVQEEHMQKMTLVAITAVLTILPVATHASSLQWCGFNKHTGDQIGTTCFRTQKQCDMAFGVKPNGPNECIAVQS